MNDFVDLTLSEESDERPSKRQRRQQHQRRGADEPGPSRRSTSDAVEVAEEPAQGPPHTRDVCGRHVFHKRPAASNVQHCSQCFCYICDCQASDCEEWGTGSSIADHCNAHAGDRAYKLMRAQHARGAAAGGAAGAGPASAAAAAGGGVAAAAAALAAAVAAGAGPEEDGGETAASGIAKKKHKHKHKKKHRHRAGAAGAAAAAGGAAACTLVEMPDPRADPTLLHLATLELRCKTVRGQTLPDISARLAPNGFYLGQGVGNQHGDRLSLENILDSEYDWGRVPPGLQPTTLSLEPLATPPAPPAPGPTRVRQVTVYHHDGRAPPTVFGVSVAAEATVEEVAASAAPLAGLGEGEELVSVSAPTAGARVGAPFLLYSAGTKVTDKSTKDQAVGVWRVPKPARTDASYPAYALVYHRKHRNYEDSEGSDWDSDDSQWDVFGMGEERLGRPTLLPLGPELASGGAEAEKALLGRLLAVLGPLRKEGAPEVQAEDLLGAGMHLLRSTPKGYTWNEDRFCNVKQYDTRPDSGFSYTDRFFEDRMLFLLLDWPTAQAQHYDWAGWTKPVVHESAGEAAMRETNEYIAAHSKWEQLKEKAKSLPKQAMQELLTAARARQPGVNYPLTAQMATPLVRVRLELQPDSARPEERRGVMRVMVFVWRSVGGTRTTHRPFFRAYDDWESLRGVRVPAEEGCITLASVLELALWQHQRYQEMKEELEECEVRDHRVVRHSIKGLMEAVERGELPVAEQPGGLTVQMRPYQLQSLQFMLDAERGEGGFRRWMWLELTTPGGERYWYSPVLRRASLEVPAMPAGGFCAEEMGLGKTVEVLGLILANPAPPLPAGVQRDENGLIKTRATLVVCAVSLVGQWVAEAQAKLGGSLHIHQYHGPNRIRDPVKLATQFDIVVTTYATLTADFQQRQGGGGRVKKGRAGGRERSATPAGAQQGEGAAATATTTSAGGSGATGVAAGEGPGKGEGAASGPPGKRQSKPKEPLPVVNGSNPNKFPPLGSIKWHRLVLDESHTVKSTAVGHTRACGALQAERRWMATGTPINTAVDDLMGQFYVLGLSPFNNANFFGMHVKPAYGAHAWNGCPSLLYALGRCMIRHTKRQVLGGEEVLTLPQLHREDVPVVLTEEEQRMYKEAHQKSKDLFRQYLTLGHGQVNRHLLQIMSLLLPMRKVCSGGVLKRKDLEVSDPIFGPGGRGPRGAAGDIQDKDGGLVAPDDDDCAICMDAFEAPVVTPCAHWFCRECILGAMAVNPRCPLCRAALAAAQLRAGVTAAEAAAAAAAAAAQQEGGGAEAGEGAAGEGGEGGSQQQAEEQGVASESKLQALLKELRRMRRADPTAKALIFSQYVSTIEWLKFRLTQEGFGYRYISGSMPLKQRAKAIEAFQNDPPTTVFLLSMRSGSVGINLTAASHVFLMEPALNPALEDQAVGRAWRMGQKREVTVRRFFVKGSVEERIMEVVKARQTAGASNHHQPRTNVRMQDVAGSIQADRQQLRVSELEVLFKDPEFPPPRVPEPPSEDEGDEVPRQRPSGSQGGGGRLRAARAAAAARGRGSGGAGRQAQRAQQEQQEEEGWHWGAGTAEVVVRAGRPLRAAAERGMTLRHRRQRAQQDHDGSGLSDEEQQGGDGSQAEEDEEGCSAGQATARRPAQRRRQQQPQQQQQQQQQEEQPQALRQRRQRAQQMAHQGDDDEYMPDAESEGGSEEEAEEEQEPWPRAPASGGGRSGGPGRLRAARLAAAQRSGSTGQWQQQQRRQPQQAPADRDGPEPMSEHGGEG